MKRIVVTILLCTNFVFAQQSSNLFQIITSDLPIERDSVFRNLQNVLSDENLKDLEGINLDILHTIADRYKEKILEYIQPVQIRKNDNRYSLVYRDKILFSKDINLHITTNQLLDSLETEIKNYLNKGFSQVTMSFAKDSSKITNVVFYLAYKLINDGNLNTLNYKPTAKYKELTAAKIASVIRNEISSQILLRIPSLNPDKEFQNYLDDYVEKFNEAFQKIADNINNEIANIFIQVHSIIREKIEKPIAQNLKGLTGFSANEGKGTFSGGMLYSFRIWHDFSLSVYTNFNFNPPTDSTHTSLIGLRGAYYITNVQIDFLASLYYGKGKYKFAEVFEAGAGINFNWGNSIYGIAGFYSRNTIDSKLSFYTVGILFKYSSDTPAVVAGIKALDGFKEKDFLFQIHYPISVSL